MAHEPRWRTLLGVPESPGALRPAPSAVAWSSSLLAGLVVMLGVSLPASALMPGELAMGYSVFSGLLQGVVVRFCLRSHGRTLGEHVLVFLMGGAAVMLLYLTSYLKSSRGDLALLGFALFLTTSVAWAVLAIMLAPASWLSRARAAEGEVMGPDRAGAVNGAALGAVALGFLLGQRQVEPLASDQRWRDLAGLLGLAAALGLLSLSACRVVIRNRWLSRVRRGLVADWKIAPRDEQPSNAALPRWDARSHGSTDGVLIFEGSAQDSSFRADPRPGRELVAIVPLGGEGEPGLRWLAAQVVWVLKVALAAALVGGGTALLCGRFAR